MTSEKRTSTGKHDSLDFNFVVMVRWVLFKEETPLEGLSTMQDQTFEYYNGNTFSEGLEFVSTGSA